MNNSHHLNRPLQWTNYLLTFANCKLPFALSFLLFAFSHPPSVLAQKIIKTTNEPKMIFRIGVGAHQIFRDGPAGGNISFNCEDPISKHLSWTANFVMMMNPIDLALPPDTRGAFQTRFIIQPDFRYYPTTVLRHLYIGSGFGIVAGYGKTIGAFPNGKSQLSIFGEALADLKIGWQGKVLEHYVWNTFVAPGLLIPLNGEKMIPIVRLGIQIGLKRVIE